MDSIEQVKKWVEKKVEDVINDDLKDKITEENSTIDVELYVNYLLDKYFDDEDVGNFQQTLYKNSNKDILYSDSENSSEERNSINDSLELEANEYQAYSSEELIKNLKSNSEEVIKKYLKILESCAEDLINQDTWNKITEILHEILNKSTNKEIQNLALKVFQKPLGCPKKPQIISKGFTSITELLINQIDKFNSENIPSFEDIRDLKEYRNPEEKISSLGKKKRDAAEIIIKLMWLLIDCQQQIPTKWIGFNEARFREIIFSFIRLLSCTTLENKNLSGVEILSVLNPSASWCLYWCHTAVGRNLLSSALRKYKSFFIQIVENILSHMKNKKDNRLPPLRDSSAQNKKSQTFRGHMSEALASNKSTNVTAEEKKKSRPTSEDSNSSKGIKPKNSEWIIESIPREIVAEAVFFHSISFISCLIQFRSGRALFPIQTLTRKRLLSVQDLSLSLIEYLENTEWGKAGYPFTSAYEAKVMELVDILKKVKTNINSSRMNTDRQHYFFM